MMERSPQENPDILDLIGMVGAVVLGVMSGEILAEYVFKTSHHFAMTFGCIIGLACLCGYWFYTAKDD